MTKQELIDALSTGGVSGDEEVFVTLFGHMFPVRGIGFEPDETVWIEGGQNRPQCTWTMTTRDRILNYEWRDGVGWVLRP